MTQDPFQVYPFNAQCMYWATPAVSTRVEMRVAHSDEAFGEKEHWSVWAVDMDNNTHYVHLKIYQEDLHCSIYFALGTIYQSFCQWDFVNVHINNDVIKDKCCIAGDFYCPVHG